ncbi:MAG TPA: DUF2235 domain-containing protein [Candidatus Thermoplasmatota archaeon]|nr:DUF2235 domain-containing protein [Candidatus Thermoplasmatota archaeon]
MKRLVVCCDGTWNTADATADGKPCPTNVVKMARAVAPRDEEGNAQVVFYDEGIGTGGLLDRVVGGATGKGLMRNVGDAYRFLVWNYEPGDEIYLFGFSRGAFTARSVAGLVRKCGVLRKSNGRLFEEAYAFYRSDVHPRDPRAAEFRALRSHEARIRVVGVWDSVGALGVPGFLRGLAARRHKFHDVKLSSIVDRAYHAVAIDERRRSFLPTLWETDPSNAGQVVEQAWFPGAHSDVGGGYPECGLSDVAFLWMAQRAQEAGLALDPFVLKSLEADPRGPVHESRRGLFKLLPAAEREIGAASHQPQSVHESAMARRADPALGYAPANLERHLKAR